MKILRLTDHPIQRAGAWAVAVMAKCEHPADVTSDDLRTVIDRIVKDLQRAATAERETPAYDWWKVQNALFPNSDVTHAARQKWPDLKERIVRLFDADEKLPGEVCVFCELPASARWSKAYLPMFDTAKALNTLPPNGLGWPVCKGCRVAMWAVPYGAAVTAGSATVLAGGSDELERTFAARNVDHSKHIQAGGLGRTVRGSPERVVFHMLRSTNIYDTPTLWVFKNDNQEPWLRVIETRRPIARFVRGLEQRPEALSGWNVLQRRLTRRDRTGAIVESGKDLAAKTLFEPSGRPQPRPALLESAFRQLTGKSAITATRARSALTALVRHYAKEMLAMDLDSLKPIAVLLARWIAIGTSPRGRFGEYARVAMDRYKLGRLLMGAEARLLLDHQSKALPMRASDAIQVIDSSRGSAYQRMLLFFAVVDALTDLGIEFETEAKELDETDEIDAEAVEDVLSSGDPDNNSDDKEYA